MTDNQDSFANAGQQEFDNNDTHLWTAVMDRAVRDLIALERYLLQDPQVIEDPIFRSDYRALNKWFHSSSMEPGTFYWICALVNIDPGWARNKLEERLQVSLKGVDKQNKIEQPISTSTAIAA